MDRVLQATQPVQRFGRELQKHRAVDQRLLIPAQTPDEFFRVLKLGLRCDALLHVVQVAPLHACLIGSGM